MFRKKPVVIEAVQWSGSNVQEITTFLAGFEVHIAPPNGEPECSKCMARFDYTTSTPSLIIPTLEGDLRATAGDWIIRGIKGEFYPCKADIFAATYEAVEGEMGPTACRCTEQPCSCACHRGPRGGMDHVTSDDLAKIEAESQ